MHAIVRFAFLGSALSLAAPPAALSGKPAAATPTIVGTWHLNLARSKYAGPAPKGETRTYEAVGDKISMHSTGTGAGGKRTESSYAAAFDGKFYPTINNPLGDEIALTRINAHLIAAILRRDHKVSGTSRALVSADARHLTITHKALSGPQQGISVQVYDKQ